MIDKEPFAIAESRPSPAEMGSVTKEVSVLDGLYVLVKRRRLILLLTLIGVLLGILVAFTTPAEYVSSAVLMREAKPEPQGGSLAALRGLGINIGEAQSGLTIEAYPDVLTSHEVRFLLLEGSFPLVSGERISFLDYARKTEPRSITGWLRKLLNSDSERSAGRTRDLHDTLSVSYTYEEQQAMDLMRRMIVVAADPETGLMTVSVEARDPELAASLVSRLVGELRTRVQSILTQKVREDYEFIRERTAEADSELGAARAMLARFDDRNRGLTSPPLLAERDRLRQEVNFATEVFSLYQSELKQAEIDIQRSIPVITVLDRPIVPLIRSSPRRASILLIAGFLGLGFGIVLAFTFEGFGVEARTESGQAKREAIRSALIPRWFRRWRRRNEVAVDEQAPPAEP